MDPNAALGALRAAAVEWEQAVTAQDRDDQLAIAARVMETLIALDRWLSGGGFLPTAWASRSYH
jgi:hypothetical protein